MRLKSPAPNPYAVATVVEATRPGEVRPFFAEKAHWDGTPIHIGAGDTRRPTLTVRFPSGEVRRLETIKLNDEMVVESKE